MCKVIWLVLTNYNALFHSRVITPLKISFIRLSAKSTSLNCFKKMKMIKREKLQWPLFCRYDIFCASMASFSASMASFSASMVSFLAQWPLFLPLWPLFCHYEPNLIKAEGRLHLDHVYVGPVGLHQYFFRPESLEDKICGHATRNSEATVLHELDADEHSGSTNVTYCLKFEK